MNHKVYVYSPPASRIFGIYCDDCGGNRLDVFGAHVTMSASELAAVQQKHSADVLPSGDAGEDPRNEHMQEIYGGGKLLMVRLADGHLVPADPTDQQRFEFTLEDEDRVRYDSQDGAHS